MSKFNWRKEALRISKMADECDAIRERLWKSDDEPLGWDIELLNLYETLSVTATQLELKIDQRPTRVIEAPEDLAGKLRKAIAIARAQIT